MKSLSNAFEIICLIVFIPFSLCLADEIKIVSIIGKVEVKKESSLFWENAKQGQVLHANDSLRTNQESTTEVKLQDGSTLLVNENTKLLLNTKLQLPPTVTLKKPQTASDKKPSIFRSIMSSYFVVIVIFLPIALIIFLILKGIDILVVKFGNKENKIPMFLDNYLKKKYKEKYLKDVNIG